MSDLSLQQSQRLKQVCDEVLRQRPSWVPDGFQFGYEAEQVFMASDFVKDYCHRFPQDFARHIANGDLFRDYCREDYAHKVHGFLQDIDDEKEAEAGLMQGLRRFRQHAMVRIAWRDIVDTSTVQQTLAELTWLAECCLDQALFYLHGWQQKTFGVPIGKESAQPQSMVVLGMGKLGGEELNFSSDVDLIFAYQEQGETCDGRRVISNEQYFVQLGQKLIKVIDQVTADGFVYRVDMRLRPFGQQGRLALNFDAMELYYQTHGRQWERYALLKARPVAGDIDTGNQLLNQLRPFIYKRYLDFEMIDSLRQMKQGIARQAQQRDYQNDIKLGPGGIREVEFIVQLSQLIHGGKNPALQTRQLLKALSALVEQQLMPSEEAQLLEAAYLFLRKVENRLQEYRDQQTHQLPQEAGRLLSLRQSLGFADEIGFFRELNRHRDRVKGYFAQIFAEVDERPPLALLWDSEEDALNEVEADQILAEYYADATPVWQHIQKFRTSIQPSLTERSRRVLQRLIPLVLEACASAGGESLLTLKRVLALMRAVLKRPNYLSLLLEMPSALEQTVRCCAQSQWMAEQLTRFPLLLDALIDHREWGSLVGKDNLHRQLEYRLQRIDRTDIESLMECLRHFKRQQVFHIASQSFFETLSVTETAAHLTELAEVILKKVLWFSVEEYVGKQGLAERALSDAGIAIIAYGKLGGRELGYASDLDLIFLYKEQEGWVGSQGYARIIQRVMHILSAYTPSGTLYEVDMRLRPEGNSGLLISSLRAYEEYQRNKAWVWEHQALIRARAIAGDVGVMKEFDDIRQRVLVVKRDEEALRQEVLTMRDKMRQSLDKSTVDLFDVKQGEGGIVDIEFVAQYLVLRYAHQYPALLQSSSTLTLIALLEQHGLLQKDIAGVLSQAYQHYRMLANAQSLQGKKGAVSRSGRIDVEFRILGLIAA